MPDFSQYVPPAPGAEVHSDAGHLTLGVFLILASMLVAALLAAVNIAIAALWVLLHVGLLVAVLLGPRATGRLLRAFARALWDALRHRGWRGGSPASPSPRSSASTPFPSQ